MTRHIAFLRAINVGGHHKVTMVELRKLFETMTFRSVETFIASGNVIFESPEPDGRKLEARIEAALLKALGFEVRTFVRSDAELAAIARYPAFPAEPANGAAIVYVGFLTGPVDAATREALTALQTDIDAVHTHGRELYWLRRQRESELDTATFEKVLKAKASFRNLNTVAKLAAKYPPQ